MCHDTYLRSKTEVFCSSRKFIGIVDYKEDLKVRSSFLKCVKKRFECLVLKFKAALFPLLSSSTG